jgi:hypothetical protein
MSRLLAPVVGIAGLLALVVGLGWAEWDMATMAGVGLVGYGVLGLVLAAGIVAVQEASALRVRRRGALPRR